MMDFLKRFLVPVVFLVVFFVTISALQTHKALRESNAKAPVTQAIELLEQKNVEQIAQRMDSHYWDADNKEQNQSSLLGYKDKLSQAGKLIKLGKPIFSVRSESIPAHDGTQSDIYIVHAKHENGEMIYTLGFLDEETEISANWKIDRLSVDYISHDKIGDEAEKSEYKLSILCSKDKGIEKKCRKA